MAATRGIRKSIAPAGARAVAPVGATLLVVALIATACGAGSAGAVGLHSANGTYRNQDGADGRAMDILPAGENGLVNAQDLAHYSSQGTRPPNSIDQVAPYNSLIYGTSGLTDQNLHDYYLDESFGIRPSDVVRTEHPDPKVAVVVYRDGHDIPHIYGSSLDAMSYGAGFVGAEDRLFLMDVLRHYGEGKLMSFVGDSCDYEAMDYSAIMSKGYTTSDFQAQLDAMPKRFGTVGSELVSMISSYVSGVNHYIAEAHRTPSMMPVEYAATGSTPQPWSPTDVVAVTTLIALEATGGGNEVQNAALTEYLSSLFGPSAANAIFDDLKEQNDPAAPTVIPERYPYMIPASIDPALTALPDHAPTSLVDLAGAPPQLTPGCTGGSVSAQEQAGGGTSASALAQQLAQSEAKGGQSGAESNAVLVDASHSADGHPIAVFGPELGYYNPEILMQEDLHAPGYDAAGAAFPGANFLVELGRGTDYAWSATTASTDQVDMRIERLCSPGGQRPAPLGTDYEYRGRCVPMTNRSFSESSTVASPATITRELHYTVHGVVQGWSTVDGHPVAVVRQDATTGHDLDQFAGYLQFGKPAVAGTPDGWMHAAADIAYTFNWFYLDPHDIAYYVSGRDPLRDPHADPNLPTWGTGVAEWRGFLPYDRHPHALDPPQGYLVSWNNKPAPGFSASDDLYAWGPVFRSQLLTTGLHAALGSHGGKLDRAQVTTLVETAATQDLDGFTLVRPVTQLIGPLLGTAPPAVSAMVDQLDQWAGQGFHRKKASPAAVQYHDAAAVAIWDEVYPSIVRALFDPVFVAGGVEAFSGLDDGYDQMTMLFAETPNDVGQHDGDGFYSGWEGYVQKALDQLAGRPVAQPFSDALMGRLCAAPAVQAPLGQATTGQATTGRTNGPGRAGTLAACRQAVLGAFVGAYASLVTANGGTTDVSGFTRDSNTAAASASASGSASGSGSGSRSGSGQSETVPEFDAIQFQQVGAITAPDMDWQNRPTYQQVVEFPADVGS